MNMLEKQRASRPAGTAAIEIGLNAAIASVHGDEPQLLTLGPMDEGNGTTASLPYGPFSPIVHRTLEIGLRTWVAEQSGIDLGYVEQLYTFGDRGRNVEPDDHGAHVVSIGYLALTRRGEDTALANGHWSTWYTHFPWEDWRRGKPEVLTRHIEPRLREWAARQLQGAPARPLQRAERLKVCFGLDGGSWDEEKVLERYEVLYEAGLLAEAKRDGREAARNWTNLPELGVPLSFDHRRIAATAMGRLRAKIKYRPVVFELMPFDFTLFELQRTVESILGSHLHKQNFRRLVEAAGLVDPTGELRTHTGGRPAKLFRFRREVLLERPAPGVRVRAGWAA